MTNREWLLNKMQNMSDEEFAEMLNDTSCICEMINKSCHECGKGDCVKGTINWLKSEHKEPITLSEAERIILENIDKDFKWIARDSDGELYIFNSKPTKTDWDWVTTKNINKFICFNHLFQFITWNDSEPYNIEDLLKGE